MSEQELALVDEPRSIGIAALDGRRISGVRVATDGQLPVRAKVMAIVIGFVVSLPPGWLPQRRLLGSFLCY
jgi:hypothetical protein